VALPPHPGRDCRLCTLCKDSKHPYKSFASLFAKREWGLSEASFEPVEKKREKKYSAHSLQISVVKKQRKKLSNG
jgi:hypothetical protein